MGARQAGRGGQADASQTRWGGQHFVTRPVAKESQPPHTRASAEERGTKHNSKSWPVPHVDPCGRGRGSLPDGGQQAPMAGAATHPCGLERNAPDWTARVQWGGAPNAPAKRETEAPAHSVVPAAGGHPIAGAPIRSARGPAICGNGTGHPPTPPRGPAICANGTGHPGVGQPPTATCTQAASSPPGSETAASEWHGEMERRRLVNRPVWPSTRRSEGGVARCQAAQCPIPDGTPLPPQLDAGIPSHGRWSKLELRNMCCWNIDTPTSWRSTPLCGGWPGGLSKWGLWQPVSSTRPTSAHTLRLRKAGLWFSPPFPPAQPRMEACAQPSRHGFKRSAGWARRHSPTTPKVDELYGGRRRRRAKRTCPPCGRVQHDVTECKAAPPPANVRTTGAAIPATRQSASRPHAFRGATSEDTTLPRTTDSLHTSYAHVPAQKAPRRTTARRDALCPRPPPPRGRESTARSKPLAPASAKELGVWGHPRAGHHVFQRQSQ